MSQGRKVELGGTWIRRQRGIVPDKQSSGPRVPNSRQDHHLQSSLVSKPAALWCIACALLRLMLVHVHANVRLSKHSQVPNDRNFYVARRSSGSHWIRRCRRPFQLMDSGVCAETLHSSILRNYEQKWRSLRERPPLLRARVPIQLTFQSSPTALSRIVGHTFFALESVPSRSARYF